MKTLQGYKRTLLVCCSNAITGRNLWVPCDTAEEKRAVRELVALDLVVTRTGDPTSPKTVFICPTEKGLSLMREQRIGDERPPTVEKICHIHGYQNFEQYPDGLRCPKCQLPNEQVAS